MLRQSSDNNSQQRQQELGHLSRRLQSRIGELDLICEQLGKNGLYIPLGKHINFKDQEYIVKSLVDSVRTNN